MYVQTKMAAQSRRQSQVHFQTPEANVVAEAAEPDQHEHNNSSKVGSTPFQAKPQRRVSFAAQNKAAEQADTHDTAVSGSATMDQTDIDKVLSQQWLDEPELTTTAASAGSVDVLLDPSDAAATKPIAADIAEAQESESDSDNSLSTDTVSIAAGSTPYLNRHMLSAALHAATTGDEEPLHADAALAVGKGDNAALSSMMARLLSDEWDNEDQHADEFAGPSQVYYSHLHAYFCSTCPWLFVYAHLSNAYHKSPLFACGLSQTCG